MHNPIPDEMLFWRNAIPLDQAALTFAPKHLREKWQHLQKQSAMKTASDSVEKANASTAENRPTFLELMKPAQDILSARAKLLNDCENHLLRHLQSGALRSFAFENPRTLASNALELPRNTWRQHHNLKFSQIKFESISYVEVRVIIETVAASLVKENLSQTHTAKAGRPSFKADIELAFAALLASGNFDLEGSIKSQISNIREWMLANTPNPKYGPDNPGYDLIRKTIRPLIETQQKQRADKL